MVVAKLQTFIENLPGGVYSTNLRELIREELSCKPTILLDCSASGYLFPSYLGFLSHTRPKIAKIEFERFVKNIISCGVDLIAVLRNTEFKDLNSWYFTKLSNWRTFETKFQKIIDKDGAHEEFECLAPFYMNFCHNTTLQSTKNEHYSVFTPLGLVHEEVAKTGIKQNCLAVIGQDSNYLIYEGIRYYISVKSVNTETLDCNVYDRNKLMEHLSLKSYQLPLFATLCGNDVVPVHHLKNFHHIISSSGSRNLLIAIAQKVKHTSAYPYQHIREMVQLINNQYINEDLILKSLNMYLQFEEKSLPTIRLRAVAEERKRTNKCGDLVFKALFSRKMFNSQMSGVFETDRIPSVILVRPIRRRIYGILLHGEDYPVVSEYCLMEMIQHNKKYPDPSYVMAVKPDCEHPGLIQLWSETTPDMEALKLRLFCSSLGSTLDQLTLISIPTRLLIPTVALHYLQVQVPIIFGEKVFTRKWELAAFLVAALLTAYDLEEKLLENWQCDNLDLPFNYLCFCFLNACYTLNYLNEACGLVRPREEFCICKYFDGALFHCVYEKMRGGARWEEFFDDNIMLEAAFSTLMEIILTAVD